MKIGGVQKLSLLDYPGKLCCTVFTAGCNFRCPFCHNAPLIGGDSPEISRIELMEHLNKRRGVIEGVCVTGGEPLLHDDIGELLEEIKSLGYLVKLDTNGSRPDMLRRLIEDGLVDYVAMDIKNSPARYAETVGIAQLDLRPIEQSILYLMSGATPYEFRTTVVRELHTIDDMLAIAEWIEGEEKYFLQSYKDSENVLKGGFSAYSEPEMLAILGKITARVPNTELRGL